MRRRHLYTCLGLAAVSVVLAVWVMVVLRAVEPPVSQCCGMHCMYCIDDCPYAPAYMKTPKEEVE